MTRTLIAALLLGAALPASAETLTLYTSQPSADAQQTVDAFMAAHPDIAVEFVRDGTTKIMAKLNAEIEAGAVAPDLLLIADTVTMEALERDGRLLAYQSPEAAAYDAALYDDEGHYYSTKLITTGIIRRADAPMTLTSWKDLTEADAQGQVAMPSPLTSGAALIHAQTLTARDAFGWEYYQALAENGAQASGGNGGVFKAVASGEKLYGVVVDFLPIREAAKGAPVEFIFPQEGVSAVTEPVAIMAGTDAPEAAQKFVDFLLSEAGQQLVVSQGYLPARDGIAPPPGFPPREEITVLSLDAGAALENAEADKARFAEIFGHK